MTNVVVVLIDTIGADAPNIPAGTLKVGGYDTGSGDVIWNPPEWALFPTAGHVHIDQSPNAAALTAGANAYDLENGACTVPELVDAFHARVLALGAHAPAAAVYATRSNLISLRAALLASEVTYGLGWWYGKVVAWLADWNLNETEAAALIGTNVEGFTCVAVQWASPTSNPNTIVPGSQGRTLAALNLDLSVAEPSWCPPAALPAPPPAPTKAQAQAAIVILTAYVNNG